METDYLREYLVFSDHLNFTSAARYLNISQPSLSRHVAELERILGVQLVDRGAELHLTYAGEMLLKQASMLLDAEDTMLADVKKAGKMPYGLLRVQHYHRSPSVQRRIADAMNEVRRANPGYRCVQVSLTRDKAIPEAVLDGALDVGIVACTTDRTPSCPVGEEDGFGIVALKECRERIYFVMRADSIPDDVESMSLLDLSDRRFVFPLNPEFERCPDNVRDMLERRGCKLRSRYVKIEDLGDLGMMSLAEDDVFIIVESAANKPDSLYLQNPDLRIIGCSDDVTSNCYLIFRKGDESSVLSAFLEAISPKR